MELISTTKMKPENWYTVAECTGNGHKGNRVPCHSTWKVESKDIVTLRFHSTWKRKSHFAYAFLCPTCHCFTLIPRNRIPDETCYNAVDVASKEDWVYQILSDEGKKLSEYLD